MKDIRKKRLEVLIQRELSDLIIKRRVKDERLGFVSVARVDLAPDLSVLTAFVSLFGESADRRHTWNALLANATFFQTSIGRNLRLRVTPKLRFERDHSIAEGDRIIEKINSQPVFEVSEGEEEA